MKCVMLDDSISYMILLCADETWLKIDDIHVLLLIKYLIMVVGHLIYNVYRDGNLWMHQLLLVILADKF